MSAADTLRAHLESSLSERLSSTLWLRERQPPLTVPIGVSTLDELTGGLPRGALSEIVGPASSGRTSVMLAALAGATRRQEICALVDATDSFDPASAERAGVDLNRLLWVRCNEQEGLPRPLENASGRAKRASFPFARAMEQVLKVTDLLLQGGGFGMVVLDLGDIPSESLRRVPLTSWFRFRRAVEPTATVLLLLEQEPWAKTCASLVLQLRPEEVCAQGSEQMAALRSSAGIAAMHHAKPISAARDSVKGRQVHCSGTQRETPIQVGGIFAHDEDSQIQLPENHAVSHAALLRGMNFRAEVVRSWTQRKPPHSAEVGFGLRAAM